MAPITTTDAFVWAVTNFSVIQQTTDQLLSQKAEFVLGKPTTVQTKWLASFRLSLPNKAKLVLKLLDKNTSSQLTVNGEISDSKFGPNGVFGHAHKLDSSAKVDQNQEISFDFDGEVLAHPSTWASFCDSSGNIFIKIELTVQGSPPLTDMSCKAAWSVFNQRSVSKLQESLAEMLTDGKLADMKIVCSDGKEYLANRTLLSARNLVFESMMSAKMTESETGVVNVDDISGETMRILLHYFYAGKLLPGWTQPEVIQEFVYAAGKYQLSEVLILLDNLLGTEDAPFCNIQLLTLVNQLGLTNAEERLAVKFKKDIESLSGQELIKMFGNLCASCQRTEAEQSSNLAKCLPPAE